MATTQNFNKVKDLRISSLLVGDIKVIDNDRNFKVRDITSRTILTNKVVSKKPFLFSDETIFKDNLNINGNIETDKITANTISTNFLKINEELVGSLCFNKDLNVKGVFDGDIIGNNQVTVPAGETLCVNLIETKDGECLTFDANMELQSDLQIGKDDGTCNTFFGFEAGNSIVTGNSNTGLGHQVMQYLTNGSENTAVGKQSMQYIEKYGYSGYDGCVALGFQALRGPSSTPGVGNVAAETVAIGVGSVSTFKRVVKSVAVGENALLNCDAEGTIALGHHACENISKSLRDVGLGTGALKNASHTTDTIAIGLDSMKGAQTSDSHISIGNRSSQNIQNCNKNVFIGNDSGNNLVNSYQNTLVGNFSLKDCNNLYKNVVVGTNSLNGCSYLTENMFIGNSNYAAPYCGENIVAGNYVTLDGLNYQNIIIGYRSQLKPSVSNTIGIGRNVYMNSGSCGLTIGPYASNNCIRDSINIGANSICDSFSTNSVVVGMNSSDNGMKNIIVGSNSFSTGNNNALLGNNVQVLGDVDHAMVIGGNSLITHGNVVSLGHNAISVQSNDLILENRIIEITANVGLFELPPNPVTYLESKINGTRYKIPLYAM